MFWQMKRREQRVFYLPCAQIYAVGIADVGFSFRLGGADSAVIRP